MTETYATLEQHFARAAHINGALAVLQWDMATMMPPGGAEARAEQVSALEVLVHAQHTDPRIGEWFEVAEGEELDDWQRANLREMRRVWRHATAVPAEIVEAQSRAGSACEVRWRSARADNDFAGLAPMLSEVIRITRERAQAKSEALGLPPYEALLDEYEPGMTTGKLDALFDPLAEFLPGFIDEVLEHQARQPEVLRPAGPFAIEAQRALGVRLMKTIGFEFDHGRLDVSHHPFCGGTPDDVRITTRYSGNDFTHALMGVIHETGHAMYERGLPAAWRLQPVGRARSTGLHESQSLLMEMQACRTRAFLDYAAPLMREAFAGEGPAWTVDNLHRLYTRVERGLIRVDADEATYPAHVILRYRLERALLDDDLEIDDLPGAWNEAMGTLLGVTPPDYHDGCLQDIHWMYGAIGYFPTYTLGAMTAAQLFDAAVRADDDIMPGIRRGDFGPLLSWLRANVHRWGSYLETDELLIRATGRPLDADVFRQHLEQRYL